MVPRHHVVEQVDDRDLVRLSDHRAVNIGQFKEQL
jgi:hypothetical protein